MLITFSHPLERAASYVVSAARKHGVAARIGHVRPHDDGTEVRFTLSLERKYGVGLSSFVAPADVAQHDAVILQLLHLDPHARVKTARAVYEGLQDFEAQMKARVP